MNRFTRNVLGLVLGIAVGVLFFSSLASADASYEEHPMGKYELALLFVDGSGEILAAQIIGTTEDYETCMRVASEMFDNAVKKMAADHELYEAMKRAIGRVEGAVDTTFGCRLAPDQSGI